MRCALVTEMQDYFFFFPLCNSISIFLVAHLRLGGRYRRVITISSNSIVATALASSITGTAARVMQILFFASFQRSQ